MSQEKLLKGVRVVELATFLAAATAGRFLADGGADVIKIEVPSGDPCRYTAASEGRPFDMNENTTWELENGNKRGLSLNMKTKEGMEAFYKLLDTADVFITNWRIKSLEKLGLDYETLKQRYPKLVYALITGYGEYGPDKDLPGFDFTAFFARGGYLECLRQPDGRPLNVIPGLGDHNVGMNLAAGILAALYHAKMTGKGEKVESSLFESAIFNMSVLLQARQYGMEKSNYPVYSRESANPINNAFKTKDNRYIQMCFPNYNTYFKTFAGCLGKPELGENERYYPIQNLQERNLGAELFEIVSECFEQKNAAEWVAILAEADLPFALAKNWDELLADEQAWANDCFYKMKYDNGNERIVVRQPVRFREMGTPEYGKGPAIGEHGVEVLKELGYEDAQIAGMLENGALYVWSDNK